MADTCRSDYSDKYCVHCGRKGCYIKHWGPLYNDAIIYLDECIQIIHQDNNIPKYNCDTGEKINERR